MELNKTIKLFRREEANSEQRTAIGEKPSRSALGGPVASRYLGFSLIEFLVVTAIIAILTTIVTVNFRQQRAQQETQAVANELISKIREVQNFILSGRVIPGTTDSATAYVINFSSSAGSNRSYRIDYRTTTVPTTTLETIDLTASVSIVQLSIDGVPTTPTAVQMYSPFGKITILDRLNATLQIRLDHTAGYSRTVIINGISGRIGVQ